MGACRAGSTGLYHEEVIKRHRGRERESILPSRFSSLKLGTAAPKHFSSWAHGSLIHPHGTCREMGGWSCGQVLPWPSQHHPGTIPRGAGLTFPSGKEVF